MSHAARSYQAAWWLPGPHTATVWGRLGRRERLPAVRLERWDTPDGDFLELARLDAPAHDQGDPHDRRGAPPPHLLLLHGLEGGLQSHYVRAMFREAAARGWSMDLLLFRSCGSEPNRLPRSYHSGETGDPAWIVDRLRAAHPNRPLLLMGVSLGGNVLCKLLGEWGAAPPPEVAGAVAMSVPFDLARASRRIGQGFGALYEWLFLRSLVPKALAKIDRHPELSSLADVARVRTIWDFDDRFTAPLHGFADAADYYRRASALGFLAPIAVPTLLLSAVDDPFLPPAVLDEVRDVVASSSAVTPEFVPRGGHVGFTAGGNPLRPWYYGEWRAAEFLAQHAAAWHARGA
ncbi:MAG: alpha/beta fold hydrolase [Gemmatimonadetes bacterium]|nr:alpha/beta fold hydrolase [Gemmatimonadota bacterium]